VLSEKLATKGSANDKLIESLKKTWEVVEKTSADDKEYKHDLEKLKKRFGEKQLLAIKNQLAKLEPISMDIPKVLSDIQKTVQSIKSLDNHKAYESKNLRDYLPTFVDRFNAKKNNPEVDAGLMTKYSFLDFATNGLKGSDFLVIAGETGFGKSLFLNNIAIQVWLQDNKISFDGEKIDASKMTKGKDIIYFSLEMPYEDCFNRVLSRLSGVPSRKIENATYNKEEFKKIKACLDFIKDYPFNFKIVDIVDASANDIEAIIVDSEQKYDAIFIDYLGIMETNEKSEEQDWLKQGIISYETRRIARRHSVPIFSAVQLNRKGAGKEASENNIGLHRLARSGTIATHCTHIIQIESRPNEERFPDFIYWLIKCRRGPRGKGILIKNLACATLLDKTDETMADDQALNDQFQDQDDISEAMEDLQL
jgi:replicative DNA helicase